jgi:hypothetical protein
MRIPMLRLVAEIPATRRRWFTPQEVAVAVASGIDGKGHVQAFADGGGFVITALLDVVNAREHHVAAANALLTAVEQSELYATRLMAARIGTWLAEGALTGLAGGLGLGTQARSDLAPLIAFGSTLVGGLFGQLCEKEIALFEWQRNPSGDWFQVQRVSPQTAPRQLGWA